MSPRLFFDSSAMPPPSAAYVIWLDAMGTSRALEHSLHHAANFVFKLHVAVAQAVASIGEANQIYPTMDGIFATFTSKEPACKFLTRTFEALATEFVKETRNHKRFLARAAIAYGPVLHGRDVPRRAFKDLPDESTQQSILLSPAMTAAYEAESLAAPFGIFVDRSALCLPQIVDKSDNGFSCRYWQWWKSGSPLAAKLRDALKAYFESAEENELSWDYPRDAQDRHKKAMNEYFSGLKH